MAKATGASSSGPAGEGTSSGSPQAGGGADMSQDDDNGDATMFTMPLSGPSQSSVGISTYVPSRNAEGGNAHSRSSVSSLSSSEVSLNTSSADPYPEGIDPLHTREQRQRNLEEVLVREQIARERDRRRAQREAEMQEFKEMLKQRELAQAQERESRARPPPPRNDLADDEDEEEYLEEFERIRRQSQLPPPQSVYNRQSVTIDMTPKPPPSSPNTSRRNTEDFERRSRRLPSTSEKANSLLVGTTGGSGASTKTFSRFIQEFRREKGDSVPSGTTVISTRGISSPNGSAADFEQEQPEITFPDGGTTAWLQVLAGFLLLFNSWGIVISFGPFQTYYAALEPAPLASESAISLIGSFQSFLLLAVSGLSGRLFDAGFALSTLLAGEALLVIGLLATAWCGLVYWKILLCQGIVCGFGMGLLFVPSVAVVAMYFQRKKALAMGIVAAGSSLGGVIYPIMARELIQKIGFSKAISIIACLAFVTLTIAAVLLRPRKDIPPRRGGPFLQLSAFKEPTYVLYTLGMFLVFLAMYTPFFYVEEWANRKGFDNNPKYGGFRTFYLISILNGSSTIGRILPNFIADRIGAINMQFPTIILSGMLVLCWLSIKSFSGIVVFVIFYGFFSGAFIGLPPAAVVSISPDIRFVGIRMGMMFSIGGVGSLIGTPIAGALVERQGGGLDAARIWSGSVLLLGGFLILAARISKVGFGTGKI